MVSGEVVGGGGRRWEAVGPTPLTRTNERRLTARRERHRPARRCLKLNLRQQRQEGGLEFREKFLVLRHYAMPCGRLI